jgi:hypothetical protein
MGATNWITIVLSPVATHGHWLVKDTCNISSGEMRLLEWFKLAVVVRSHRSMTTRQRWSNIPLFILALWWGAVEYAEIFRALFPSERRPGTLGLLPVVCRWLPSFHTGKQAERGSPGGHHALIPKRIRPVGEHIKVRYFSALTADLTWRKNGAGHWNWHRNLVRKISGASHSGRTYYH